MSNYKFLFAILGGLFVLIFNACEPFIEDDIEGDGVILLAPRDGVELEVLSQTFWWEYLEGAENYRLQIVSPSFKEVKVLLLDTLISSDKFTQLLYADTFQWRVRAENSAYQTLWSTAGLVIYSSDDLKRQKITGLFPQDNFFSGDEKIQFKWDSVPFADNYHFAIYSGAWEETLAFDTILTRPDKFVIPLSEGEYYWGVQARNVKSNTLYQINRLVVDTTAPFIPVLLQPADSALILDSVLTFSWNSFDTVWTNVTDTLFIYEQSQQLTKRLIYKASHDEKHVKITLQAGKEYFWSVLSLDRAGNVSKESNQWFFSIGPKTEK